MADTSTASYYPVRLNERGNQIIEGLPKGVDPRECVICAAPLEIQKVTGMNIVAIAGPDETTSTIAHEKGDWQDE
ncbi:MAG: hypothetical protein A2122_00885 [Candidatus Liptonbacteria bacterium GWB1_49_6]|uniref:Uncharacterized protein n=1 Tax=Candidatus Liptonbacteria bacterium GWB1_49_6 TaxID=1798644 RepID=A0A1G2C5K2_9BACT|nr:MAG: hypothetical protein A2122_00885 [Candidatus Liptonbacteria bacterium GWB1_49_6]